MKSFQLLTGDNIPRFGYGTWKNRDQNILSESIAAAYEAGFCLIDGARAYDNEAEVGQAIIDNKIPRDELFLTSKLPNSGHGYYQVFKEIDATLTDLQTEYLDLYLIHWPVVHGHQSSWPEDNLASWKAMEEMYDKGILRNIGVSNFSIEHLQNLQENANIVPAVNQILFHPGVMQQELVDYCRNAGIVIEAYSPLAPLSVLSEELWMQEMTVKYHKSVAQILLRFVYQAGIIPLTKSSKANRVRENFDIFDFEIDGTDMTQLSTWEHPDFKAPNNTDERPPQAK